MSDTSLKQKILTILQERSNGDGTPIDRETRLFEMGDSLDRVETIMELEEQFELSIPDAEAEQIQTVGGLIDYIEQRLAAPAGAAVAASAPESTTPNDPSP